MLGATVRTALELSIFGLSIADFQFSIEKMFWAKAPEGVWHPNHGINAVANYPARVEFVDNKPNRFFAEPEKKR